MYSLVGGVCAALAFSALLLSGSPAAASDTDMNELGVNAASVGLTLLYAPVKLVYSTLGLVIGGMAYGLSGGDSDVIDSVVTPAVRGDYVVMPDHVRQERSIEFFGRDPDYQAQVESSYTEQAVVFEETY